MAHEIDILPDDPALLKQKLNEQIIKYQELE